MPIISEKPDDIITAPANSVILHACNAKGKWGAGVAKQLRLKVCDPKSRPIAPAILGVFWVLSHLISQYPQAFEDYEDHCKDVTTLDLDARRQSLVGTCIITPVRCSDLPPTSRKYIASLITSLDYGKRVDAPLTILENTRKAFQSFKDRISQISAENATNGIDSIGNVWAVRLNSGLFKVPWEETRAILDEEDVPVGRRLQHGICIVYPPEINVVQNPQNNICIVKLEGREKNKNMKRKFGHTDGSSATPGPDDARTVNASPVDSGSDDSGSDDSRSDDPHSDDPGSDDPDSDNPSPIPGPIPSPETAQSKTVNIPKLRPSKRKVALDKTYKSTRGERTVSSARVKKPKDRDRQKRFTK